jgi:hypothetical protein
MMCREADIVATVSSLVSLLLAKNYHQSCCYRQLIISGVVVTAINYCRSPKINENMRQGLITSVNDTAIIYPR